MFLHSFRSIALLSLLLVNAAVLPTSLRAQRSAPADRGNTVAQASTVATPASVISADPTPAAGPRRAQSTFIRPMQPSPPGLTQPQNGDGQFRARSNLALMDAGVAAAVVGVIVGGDGGTIMALTGGVLGLVGLYRFLR